MAQRPKPIPALGALELEVLEHLWRVSEADVVSTHAAIGRRRGITANTIGSALERLFKKGLVTRVKHSHAYRYRAACGRDELNARRLATLAGDLRSIASGGLLAAFVDLVADADDEALDRLEALIAEKKGGRTP